MIIDRYSLQPQIRANIEYYEQFCVKKDIDNFNKQVFLSPIILLFMSIPLFFMFFGNPLDSSFELRSGVFLFIGVVFFIIFCSGGLLANLSRRKTIELTTKGYSLVLGQLQEIEVITHHHRDSNGDTSTSYSYHLIIDNETFNITPSRFISKDFKYVRGNSSFHHMVISIPVNTQRLFLVDLEDRNLIFDLTNCINTY